MVAHAAMFSGIRVLEILVALPIVGMLGWFVNPYVQNNSQVPDNLLWLFIVSILASAWAIATFWQFHKYRDISGPFIAVIDIGFVAVWIVAIVKLRGISNADCGNLSVPIGVQIGDKDYSGGSNLGYHVNKPCAMLKASWILAIIDCILFFITCVLSWSLYRSYKYGSTRTTHKEYAGRRSGSTSTYSSHRRHHRHV